MKTYNVKEIAEMLNTNPETVRRWIRLGKLKAGQQSRKEGSVVTEQNLNEFLKLAPKYAKIATVTLSAIGLTGLIPNLSVIFGATLGEVVLKKTIEGIMANNSQISVSEIEKFIESTVQNSYKLISQKEDEIKSINQEITYEKSKIDALQKTLKEIQSCNKDSISKQKGVTDNGEMES
ncbi:MAG: helix-turn-helix domain-containing protein [Oscillospiraceae bacterium]|nr:helix-turn-helix domain-containing protein [Oscillospiraceae bacterium]